MRSVRRAENFDNVVVSKFAVAVRNANVGNRKRVAHAAFTRAGNGVHRLGRVFFAYFIIYTRNQLCNRGGGNQFEIEPQTARQNGRRQFMHFGSRQNKHSVRGRFFKRLKQRVKRLGGEHMHFVDNIDFVLARNGRILHFVANISYVFYLVVGRGVHLHNVEIGGVLEFFARLALPARTAVYGRQTIYRTSEHFRRGGLSRSARAAKQVRVPDFIRFYLIDERADDMFLPDNLVKRFGAKRPV